ncbi:Jem1p KNAG_0B05240 [Huiozyma naganishii CBS 8797]|uniref:J domain-containing protein n=1 Tax=Huiozyma naganishii (strain ATCC MYA-139 / BCRC 22969 / CBS 8797 / KCTC 17520 / NBRC 10181 / NCYC 3082 / Yp74L-3) TaxID=1071383 RepID=J7RVJ9_HUIN7|nr:hypothetical protein KNAG_0B05240 [Kazachstania naganishii CBS 8797]CCK68957.1 hypothetical protein KNAG_0B05240 [Kazachstania naganishii CBS 8797]
MIVRNVLTRKVLCCLLFFLPAIVVASESESECGVAGLQTTAKGLGFEGSEISRYLTLVKRIDKCIAADNKKDRNYADTLKQLRNQLYYKAGLLQLSLGQELKAMSSFESMLRDQDYRNSYTSLATKRLNELYIEFGFWDKLTNDEDNMAEIFSSLNSTLFQKLEKGASSIDTLPDELRPMLDISPYDLTTLQVSIEFLTKKLSENLEPSFANELVRHYDLVLEKYKTSLTLDQRLKIHHANAILLMVVLNSDPSHQLRRCLAIDMDYSPCKILTLLNSKLEKINPHRAQILDPDVYAFPERERGGRQATEVHWENLAKFYLDLTSKPCIRKLPKDYKFANNYELIMDTMSKLLNQLFEDDQPLATRRMIEVNTKGKYATEFGKYIDLIVCESSIHTSHPITKKLKLSQYCKKCLKSVLDEEQWEDFNKALTKKERLPDNVLNGLWNNYPNMAIYMVDTILHKHKVKSGGISPVQDEILQFFTDNHLNESENKFIKKQRDYINKLVEKKQQQEQEQFQNHHQQFFNFGQQQYQQHQHHQQQQQQYAEPPPKTDKDYYKILGVAKNSDSKNIRKAYLNLTKKYHPDKQGQLSQKEQEQNHEKMSEINEAYEILGDESKKKEYDDGRLGNGNAHFRQQQGAPFGRRGGQMKFKQGGGFPFGNGNFKMNFGH